MGLRGGRGPCSTAAAISFCSVPDRRRRYAVLAGKIPRRFDAGPLGSLLDRCRPGSALWNSHRSLFLALLQTSSDHSEWPCSCGRHADVDPVLSLEKVLSYPCQAVGTLLRTSSSAGGQDGASVYTALNHSPNFAQRTVLRYNTGRAGHFPHQATRFRKDPVR